ncbi:MAG: hypothetical protein ACOCS7_00935 [Halolamina sp.]
MGTVVGVLERARGTPARHARTRRRGSLSPETIGTIAIFALAFAALNRGIDRVVTGLVREALYRDAQ